MTQAIAPQGYAALLIAFAQHGDDPFFAIQVAHAQVDEFRDTNAGIIEQPEDGAIADHCALGQWSRLVGRGAGKQQPFKLFRFDDLNARLADLWKHHPLKRVLLNGSLTYQPVEKGARRT